MLVLVATLLSCTSSSPSVDSPGPPAGWVTTLAREPTRFAALVEADGDRAAWAALHRGEPHEALQAAGTVGHRARLAAEQNARDVDRVVVRAWPRLGSAWDERGGIPPQSALPRLVADALGDIPAAAAWRERAAGVSLSPTEQACATARERALSAGDPSLLAPCRGVQRAEASGAAQRQLYDPLLARSRAQALAAMDARQPPSPSSDPLAATLFSSTWGPCPEGAPGCHEGWLGVATLPTTADDARAELRRLDQALNAALADLRPGLEPAGAELLDGLRLDAVFRARHLTARARACLDAGHPAAALVFAQAARDLEAPREIGPASPPAAFALSAAASLDLGRTRAALDALRVLADHDPTAQGAAETVALLAVVESLSRAGDSKEQ